MVYSAPAGTVSPTRMRPWFNSRLCPAAPSAAVTDGQLAPSNGANRGSLPPVAANTARAASALRPNALAWKWQLPQVRPLVPKLWKNALPRSIVPAVLTVPSCPAPLGDQEDLEGCPGRGVQPLAGRKGRLVGLAGEQQGSRAQRGQGHSVGLHEMSSFPVSPAMRGKT